MQNNVITLEHLNTIIPALKEFVSWENLKHKPFEEYSDGTVKTLDLKYLQGKGYNSIKLSPSSFSSAKGRWSIVEGYDTTANGVAAHAEGYSTIAGYVDTTNTYGQHAEGYYCKAFDTGAHAEGCDTQAYGRGSHAEGCDTIARSEGVHVQGKYNPDPVYTPNAAHIVGNGENGKRSNAHTLDWDGTAWFAGDVYVGSKDNITKDEGSKKLATEEYVMSQISSGAKGTPFVQGSGTTSSTAKISTWTGSSDEITEYYDGLAIRYKIGVEGQSTVMLNINGLGAKTVYRFNTTKLTTQFPVGSIINLIYHTDLNGGCWITNDYDANTNTYQRVYESSDKNVEYPITARYATTSGTSYYAEYGRYSDGVTLNPSTNTITATNFKGNLTGTATKASQDSQGNVIADTYATKSYVQQEITSKTLTLTGIDAEGISHTWTIYGVAQ